MLPAREQYIVTTSEFDAVKARLQGIENRYKLQDKKGSRGKPSLRIRTEHGQSQGGQDGQKPSAQSGDDSSKDPDRPTLRRRPEDAPDNQDNQ